jgi:hypothetical protein
MQHEMAFGKGAEKVTGIRMGTIAARVGALFAIVDDIIDNATTSVARKKAFLENVYMAILEGTSQEGCDASEEFCYRLAKHLYQECFVNDKRHRARAVFGECVTWLCDQWDEYDPYRLLVIEQGIGATSAEIVPTLVEIEEDISLPAQRCASRCLGAAGQLIDDWADLDEDVRNEINTYGTMRLRNEGDSKGVRASICMRYRALANALIDQGAEVLTSKVQREIYMLISSIVRVRYAKSVFVPGAYGTLGTFRDASSGMICR